MTTPRTTVSDAGRAVLEDPSGRRARRMRRAGRVVFVVFLGWLLAVLLGGLGLAPVGGIPFSHALRPSSGPAPLAEVPRPRQPSPSDLRPAISAKAAAAIGTASPPAQSSPVRQRGRQPTASGRAKTTTLVSLPGHSATAPGHTQTTTTVGLSRDRSMAAPGRVKTTTGSHGRSTTAPGHTRTTTTTTTTAGSHGRSPSAPGRQKK